MENSNRFLHYALVVCIASIGGAALHSIEYFSSNEMQCMIRNLSAIILVPPIFLQLIFTKRKPRYTLSILSLVIATLALLNLISYDASYFQLVVVFSLPCLLAIHAFATVGDQVFNGMSYLVYFKDLGKWIILAGLMGITFMMLFMGSMALAYTIVGDINESFIEQTLKWTLPSIPVFALYIQRQFPLLLKDVAFIIASVFAPITLLVLLTQLVLLLTHLTELKENRDFLFVFNIALVAVLALIAYVGIELEKRKATWNFYVLLALSGVAVIINALALYGISYRIGNWGWSANKLAIIGSNIILFCHFCCILYSLISGKSTEQRQYKLNNALVCYLPIYIGWITFIVFLVPFLFA